MPTRGDTVGTGRTAFHKNATSALRSLCGGPRQLPPSREVMSRMSRSQPGLAARSTEERFTGWAATTVQQYFPLRRAAIRTRTEQSFFSSLCSMRCCPMQRLTSKLRNQKLGSLIGICPTRFRETPPRRAGAHTTHTAPSSAHRRRGMNPSGGARSPSPGAPVTGVLVPRRDTSAQPADRGAPHPKLRGEWRRCRGPSLAGAN